MSTVIYLFNQKVQILTGTAGNNGINIKKSYIETAPEGSIINGIVMDVEAFVGFLKGLVADKKIMEKDTYLVVSSTKFVGRTIELPVLNEKKTLDYIMRDFADIGKTSDSLFGCVTLPGGDKKFRKVYAESIEPDFIKDYVDMFREAGVKLKGIYSGESCLIDFTAKTVAKDSSTFDLIIANDSTLSTVLWVEGAFYHYNSTRSFNNPGTEEYAADIARSVSQLNQFIQTRRIETPLEDVIIAGVNPDDIAMYAEAIREAGISTPVKAFKVRNATGFGSDGYKFVDAVSGLYTHDKKSNFLTRLVNKSTEKEGSAERKRAGYIVFGITVLMIIITALLWFVKSDKEKKFAEIDDYINSPDTVMDVTAHDKVADRNNFLNQQYRSIMDINDNINTYPLGNSTIVGYIDRCASNFAEVDYSSFDANEGRITFQAFSDDVEQINQFIKQLTNENIFKDVDYTGYRFDEYRNKWIINVTCTLAEAAGREEQ